MVLGIGGEARRKMQTAGLTAIGFFSPIAWPAAAKFDGVYRCAEFIAALVNACSSPRPPSGGSKGARRVAQPLRDLVTGARVQKLGGVQALTTTHGVSPTFLNLWGVMLGKR